mmetsp:Transcript_1612/g.1722  ORF Transcript_1612/g.1722 Transcript_1612/m.1722 type:complete len:133 (+) Transcript_1612:17-415(+)
MAMTPDPEKLGAELPAGVQGTMDGEKPPLSQVEELRKAIEPFKLKYGHYLTQLRPWREFIRLSKPEGDIQKRLQVNLSHFQINYAVIFLLQLATCGETIATSAVGQRFVKSSDSSHLRRPEWDAGFHAQAQE